MMFESSQFDSTPGFVSSQTADPSPSSAKTRDAQPMYPVTVKQIVEATPSDGDKSDILIDGISVYNVKLVGMVFDKTAKVTDVSFVIDDGTGRIGCKRWVNDAQDTQEVEELTDGIYVRVHGHLSSYKGKKEIVLYAIRPVKGYNEIAYHFVECAHAHCTNTKLQKNGSVTLASSTATTPNNGQQAITSSQVSQDHSMDGLGSIDKMVLDYLQLPTSNAKEQGIHRNEIAQKLKISQEKIAETMESLESEGLVYSTIDEFHYKSVSA
ncbi:replication protein A 32 kDa subunit A-like [Salvia splendens]|uniref:replication protein A 32 kDa subunit A-like n=1 Tax=Salvia splendens TaxID=180675 RepID=UPI001C25BC2F|nr:replication protein A 32 kDa subunit A-like [Salvia splendens]